jgi:hypothetical protein
LRQGVEEIRKNANKANKCRGLARGSTVVAQAAGGPEKAQGEVYSRVRKREMRGLKTNVSATLHARYDRGEVAMAVVNGEPEQYAN